METRRKVLLFLILNILNKPRGFSCVSNNASFTRFKPGEFLDGNVCPDGNVIKTTSYVNSIKCLTLCSTMPQCYGVFVEPEAMRCVTCSAMYYIKKSTPTVSKFYKRHEKRGVSAYQVVTQKRKWYGAKKHCENLGGHLLILTSEEENDYVVQYVQTFENIGQFLIGGKGTGGRSETFTWVDGTNVSDGYTNWRGGQPHPKLDRERYIRMLRGWNFQWNDEGDTGYPSICEFD